jgi:hypothetical protein
MTPVRRLNLLDRSAGEPDKGREIVAKIAVLATP